MTISSQPVSSGLPVRTPASEPEWVRKGSSTVQKDYQAALQFEEELVTQMASSLTQESESSGASGEEGSESAPGASVYSSMLPQALASSVVSGGGFGLAAEMTRQLAPQASQSAASATVETNATTGGASAT